MSKVSYDKRAVLIDGKRMLLLSGAIHYPRSTPAMWSDLLRQAKLAGLNTVETYVFWGLHERMRGVFDFSERLDLFRFCCLAQEQGLYVFLRFGPYICAEINYGGFPVWLRNIEGIRIRTYNQPFMDEVEGWLHMLCAYLKPLFAPNGGPIILAQMENEYGLVAKNYGEEGKRYLQWAAKLAQQLEVGVPWLMCEGSAPGMIATLNGFAVYKRVDELLANYPDQPMLWTENWTGWYETWGYPRRMRTKEELAYAIARFFAIGGTGVNYYMWHGGTNFGRDAMYLQATSYYGIPSVPLDEYGLPTPTFYSLQQLHHFLQAHADVLLHNDHPTLEHLGVQQVAYTYGQGVQALTFLCNDHQEDEATITFEGREYTLPALSISLIHQGRVLMNTAEIAAASGVQRTMQPAITTLAPFTWYAEPIPPDAEATQPVQTVSQPCEQLHLTHDETDYCWYTTQLSIPASDAGTGILTIGGIADLVHVFVDGVCQASSQVPLLEDRGPFDGAGFVQQFSLTLPPGEHVLSLLCCALGLIKGDWMIGNQNMAEERKGIWGTVRWKDRAIEGPWHMRPGLVGEWQRWFAEGGEQMPWRNDMATTLEQVLRWWRIRFARPAGKGPWVVDLQGMRKGLLWLNGRCIGRYWLIPGAGQPPWKPAILHSVQIGQPTQRYYHLPTEWLAETNTLVLFDELGGTPQAIQVMEVEPGNT
jgi:beta-galactosidase